MSTIQLRPHQSNGVQWARKMLESRVRDLDAAYRLKPLPVNGQRVFKYEEEEWLRLLHRAEENVAIEFAWDMRLGKTLGALEVAELIPTWLREWQSEGWLSEACLSALTRDANGRTLPTLIVCPNHIKPVWLNEMVEHMSYSEFDIEVFDTSMAARQLNLIRRGVQQTAVISYNTLTRLEGLIDDIQWGLVIYDEVHWMQHSQTGWTQTAMGIRSQIRIGLSGTPQTNHIDSLWQVLAMLQGETVEAVRQDGSTFRYRTSTVWGSKEEFVKQYQDSDGEPRMLAHGDQWKCRYHAADSVECECLNSRMQRELMSRVLFKDVKSGYEPAEIEFVAIEMTPAQESLYAKVLNGVVDFLAYEERAGFEITNPLAILGYAFAAAAGAPALAQMCANKLEKEAAKNSIMDFAGLTPQNILKGMKSEDYSGILNWLAEELDVEGKVIVAIESQVMARVIVDDSRIREKYGAVVIDGALSAAQYEKNKYEFLHNPKCKMVVMTKVGSEGIDMSVADTVVLCGKYSYRSIDLEQICARTLSLMKETPVRIFCLAHEYSIHWWLYTDVISPKALQINAAIDGGRGRGSDQFRFNDMSARDIIKAIMGKKRAAA